jgi:hypothetical protein
MATLGVIELRQYQLRPGRRDELIDLFDDHLLEPQAKCGMRVLGQFRDLDRPDWFVWLRGFTDMARRPSALGEFYYGPVWSQHRAAANATMVDSDDVLLLRPAPSLDPRWEPGHEIGLVEIAVRPTARRDEERELAHVAEELSGQGDVTAHPQPFNGQPGSTLPTERWAGGAIAWEPGRRRPRVPRTRGRARCRARWRRRRGRSRPGPTGPRRLAGPVG